MFATPTATLLWCVPVDAGSDLVMELLVQNPDQDLQCRSFHGDTLLTAAVRASNFAALDLILPLVDPNEANANGRTALFLAVSQKESKMVESLLSDTRLQPDLPGVLPLSMSSSPITAFAFACGVGNVSIIEMLHDDDRVNVDIGEAAEPVRRAWASRRIENVEFLLHSNKSQHARLQIFRLACDTGQVRLAEEALLLAGDTERTSHLRWLAAAQRRGMEDLFPEARHLNEVPVLPLGFDTSILSLRPIPGIANRQNLRILEHHLYRRDVLTAISGSQALRWILRECELDATSRVRIAEKSIAAGVNIEFCVEAGLPKSKIASSRYLAPKRKSGREFATATGAAAAANCVPLIQTLLKAGADPNGNGLSGLSPLYFAVTRGIVDALQFLLSQPGIDLSTPDVKMDTLLSIAVKMTSIEIAEMLLPKGDPNHHQEGLNSLLYTAVDTNNYEMVALLLSSEDLRLNDVEIGKYRLGPRNLAIARPTTPFACACGKSCLEIVQLLHDDSRTDVNLCIYGQPPVKDAPGREDRRILHFLLQSEKITTGADYAFRQECRHEPPDLAQQIIQSATDRDRKYAKEWIRVAEKYNHRFLVEAIREKWKDV
ncbi:hypothetical protein NLG97_g6344 [Lecanicillium saksenae]|uniref:Uncharacterized protein n=1 Tax=Lecanicillium saksenae TaxID=468837 RepID=A0ACC1QR78_9HYPO|nr:hypothetical protein NLG97_g6344 [Lecanicillium saksenae]